MQKSTCRHFDRLTLGVAISSLVVLVGGMARESASASLDYVRQSASGDTAIIEEICDLGVCVEHLGFLGRGFFIQPEAGENVAGTFVSRDGPVQLGSIARNTYSSFHSIDSIVLNMEMEVLVPAPFGPFQFESGFFQLFQVNETTQARVVASLSNADTYAGFNRFRLCEIGASCNSFATAFDLASAELESDTDQLVFEKVVELQPGTTYQLFLQGRSRGGLGATHAGSVGLVLIPEPGTALLVGFGLIGLSRNRGGGREKKSEGLAMLGDPSRG